MAVSKYKQLNEFVSVSQENGKTTFLVDNSWTFDLPKGIEYFTDVEFDGDFGLSGFKLTTTYLVLKGQKSGGKYVFNVECILNFILNQLLSCAIRVIN